MIEATLAQLEHIFTTHVSAVLWLSGGKDSLALTHLCRPWADQIVLLHNAVDMGHPGVWEHLDACAQAWGFPYLLRTSPALTFDAYVEQYGWPMDVVPTVLDGVASTPFHQVPKVSSWWVCTIERQLKPLITMTQRLGARALLTGSRASDAPQFAAAGAVVDGQDQYGWRRYNPLHDWSTAQVYAYLEANGIALPPHYAWKRAVSFEAPDCQACTWHPAYWAVVKTQYPEVYAAYWPQVRALYRATMQQMDAYTQEVEALLATEDTDGPR